MNVEQLSEIKEIITKKIAALSHKAVDSDIDFDGDESDEIQGAVILNMVYEHNDRNNALFAALRQALEKIDIGEYGICEECGEEIPYKRILICPEAKYCIKCAELQEKYARNFKNGRVL